MAAVRTASALRILIVEGEPDLALVLSHNLQGEGYVVESVQHGDEADLLIAEDPPDLVILDWTLPGLSGIEICRRARLRKATRTLPIIIVTGRGAEAERVLGLSAGADDYVVKPFAVLELLARMHAVLRRSRPQRIAERPDFGGLVLDRVMQRVHRGDRCVDLSPTQFRLLEYLLERPGRVFSRAQLLDAVWGRTMRIQERTVDVHIGRLRRALSRRRESDPIRTIHGIGYGFDENFGKR
jgi:two-component system, OmpR family, phosphate regulon response regulator PhoB